MSSVNLEELFKSHNLSDIDIDEVDVWSNAIGTLTGAKLPHWVVGGGASLLSYKSRIEFQISFTFSLELQNGLKVSI